MKRRKKSETHHFKLHFHLTTEHIILFEWKKGMTCKNGNWDTDRYIRKIIKKVSKEIFIRELR